MKSILYKMRKKLVLLCLVIPIVLGTKRVGSTQSSSHLEKSRINHIRNALNFYQIEHNTFPYKLNALSKEHLLDQAAFPPNKPLLDHWQREYYYQRIDNRKVNGFALRSKGPDGILGTCDDILPNEAFLLCNEKRSGCS
jgi:hypothetical protein